MESDGDLPELNALRFGQRAAWDVMYRRLWDAGMKVVCTGLAGDQHRAEREDLVQNAIAELHRKFFGENSLNQFRSTNDVCGMMHTITSRRLVDFHRRNYRRREDAHAEPPETGAVSPEAEPEGGAWNLVAGGLDDTARLWELVGRLKPPKPELLEDRFIHQLSASDVEAKRGMPRGTVLSHWHASFKQLRTWLSVRTS